MSCAECDPMEKCPNCEHLGRCGGCAEGYLSEKYELFCDETCPHTDPINSYCWKLWRHIEAYDLCHGGFTRDENDFINYGKVAESPSNTGKESSQ